MGRSVRLTEAGEVLLRYAQHVLQSLEDAKEAMGELQGMQRGRLKVSATSTIGIYTLPKVLGLFKGLYPGLDITLQVTTAEEVIRHLLDQQADLGFTGPHVLPPELIREPYLRDELVLIVAPTHRLAHEKTISVREIMNEVFIFRERGSGTREIINKELSRLKIRFERFMELSSAEAIKQAVAANLGIAVISQHAITLEMTTGGLWALEIRDLDLHRQLYVTHYQDRPLKRAAQEFLSLLRRTNQGEEAALAEQPARSIRTRKR
jgi:DNA-binding transcriptional LysR family regulator